MTEEEWLACTDPAPMLSSLRDKAGDRLLRLFAVACCRRIWCLLADERSRHAVEVAERFADGSVDETELGSATLLRDFPSHTLRDAAFLTAVPQCHRPSQLHRYGIFDLARLDEEAHQRIESIYLSGFRFPADVALAVARRVAVDSPAEPPIQAVLLRCLLGSLPFRAVSLDPAWLSWQRGLVVSMARRMYDSRVFTGMPVLADALEDAGCSNPDILGHCRSDSEHARGCWVVDLLLGKR